MRFIKFLAAIVVYHIPMLVNAEASSGNFAATFIKCNFSLARTSCGSSEFLRNNNRFTISIKIEVTSYMMWIEIIFLKIKWSWYFSSLIELILREHCRTIQIIDKIPIFINQIPSLICWSTLFINKLIFSLCQRNNVSFFITIQVSNNITFIKFSRFQVWGSFNYSFFVFIFVQIQSILLYLNFAKILIKIFCR